MDPDGLTWSDRVLSKKRKSCEESALSVSRTWPSGQLARQYIYYGTRTPTGRLATGSVTEHFNMYAFLIVDAR